MSTPGPGTVPNELALSNRFRDLLDRNGYPFQYAVLRKLHEISEKAGIFSDGTWVYETAEFPASTGAFDTRIDFVLRHSQQSLYIAAECKRVDPKFSDWCFVKAPYVRRGRSSERLFVDTVEIRCHLSGFEPFSYGTGHRLIDEHAYHLGFAVKNILEKGESTVGERKVIEDAAGQVCKGLNGLVSIIGHRAPVKRGDAGTVVVRVMAAIFNAIPWIGLAPDLGCPPRPDLGNQGGAVGPMPKEQHVPEDYCDRNRHRILAIVNGSEYDKRVRKFGLHHPSGSACLSHCWDTAW